MRRILIAVVAVVACVGLALALPLLPARAQGLTRVCVPWFGSSGQLNCVETGWLSQLLNGLSNTVTAVKQNNSGQLGGFWCANPGGTRAYLQIFDAATPALVTLGTTTPTVSFGIMSITSGSLPPDVIGLRFANGIQVAATTTATGSAAPSTALDCNAFYN